MCEDNSPCTDCAIGYHQPFNRFEKIAVVEDGPTLLMRCNVCGTLWHESLHSARKISKREAESLYVRKFL